VWAVPTGGSRRALAPPRLRRLRALSRRPPLPVWLPWLRRSALGGCPGFAIAQDGIEDGEQLAHRRDEGEASGFAGIAQTAVEALERRVVPDRDQAGHVERRPDFAAAASDPAFATVSAAIPADWRDTGQGGDLVAIDLAELGQLGDQGAGNDIADAGHPLQDQLVDARALGFGALEHDPGRALRDAVAGSGQALLFFTDHDHELAPPLRVHIMFVISGGGRAFHEAVVEFTPPGATNPCLPRLVLMTGGSGRSRTEAVLHGEIAPAFQKHCSFTFSAKGKEMKSVGGWATGIGLMLCMSIGTVALGPRVQAGDSGINAEMSRIQRGFEIAPVPLNLKGKDRELVGAGELSRQRRVHLQ